MLFNGACVFQRRKRKEKKGNTTTIAILMKTVNSQLVRLKQNVKRRPSVVCYNRDRLVHRWVPEMVLNVQSESLNHLKLLVGRFVLLLNKNNTSSKVIDQALP